MSEAELMVGAPPSPRGQVTLENWRRAPFARWSFHNVRNLLPTASIRRDLDRTWHLGRAEEDLSVLPFQDPTGQSWTLADWLTASESDGFLVLRGDQVVFERYFGAMGADVPHILMSVSKSVTGILSGILVERGLLDPDGPIVRILPEVAGSAYETATVRHLLDMSVGIDFAEDYEAEDGAIIRYREASGWKPPRDPSRPGDLRSFLTSLPPAGRHGACYHYVSPNSDLLGWVLERATGRSFAALMSEEVWRPMGAECEAYVALDRLGAARSAGGLCMTLRDLGRFGRMVLDGGLADDRQIVSAWWIEDIRNAGDPVLWCAGDYGYMFPDGAYRSQWYATGYASGAFCAIGIHGQFLYLVPQSDLVIAKFSSAARAVDESMEDVSFAAFEAIAAHFA